MTTRTDHLALIKATIDTQYDLARIELFRPLEIYDRFHGIKPKCGCTPTFESHIAGTFPLQGKEWDALEARLATMRTSMPPLAELHVYQNVASCACNRFVRYSVRVSITWNGRTLMREYLLPEATEARDKKRSTKEG